MKAQLPDASMKLRQQNQTESTSKMLDPLFSMNLIGQAFCFTPLFGYAVSNVLRNVSLHKCSGF